MRFTPTPVGNIDPPGDLLATSAVHPHACGEYSMFKSAKFLTYGSPPRLWGICQNEIIFIIQIRFTPTPVGNISQKYLYLLQIQVHPHACGEYGDKFYRGVGFLWFTPTPVGNIVTVCVCISKKSGSPPRLWGIYWVTGGFNVCGRFTPTPVGNMTTSL